MTIPGPRMNPSSVTQASIAPTFHLIGLLLLLSGIAAAGFLAQDHAALPTATAHTEQISGPGKVICIYLFAIFVELALFYYCYAGVRRGGGQLASLSAGRWTPVRDVPADMVIAVPFWILWEGALYSVHYLLNLLGPASTAATVDGLLPRSLIEIVLWIFLCLTAGFCEEAVFRGYLQKQFHALTGSIVIAVILQAMVFGMVHAYQGWKNVVVITVLGLLYGVLAAWRRNLRANMISHAWSDIWEGWLKFVLFR